MSESPADSAPHASDDLLKQAVDGDQVAFRTLYLDLQPRLRRYAASLIGHEADDVTGEAWLQIVRDMPRFEGDLAAFRAWTARIVRNRAIDMMRQRQRRPADPMPDLEDTVLVAGDDTERDALTRVTTEEAVRLIASLPRDQAEAVMLRVVVALDAKRAAAVLGKSPAAVRVAAHRGLRRLARMIESNTRKGGRP